MPGASDFDFLPGSWDVRNRRLTDMLDPACDTWEEFDATSDAEAMLDGYGNLDHFRTDGYEGFSLRLYSPEEDLWRIWWSSTRRPGRLDPPVEGRFAPDGTTARFETEDVLDGVRDQDALRLVGDHRDLRPLGPGLLVRRREDLEAQLDDVADPARRVAAARRRGRGGERDVPRRARRRASTRRRRSRRRRSARRAAAPRACRSRGSRARRA